MMPPMPWGKVIGGMIGLLLLWGLSYLVWWQALGIAVGVWLVTLVGSAALDVRDERRRRARTQALMRVRARLRKAGTR